MAARKAKPQDLQAQVHAIAVAADHKPLADALLDIVRRRTRNVHVHGPARSQTVPSGTSTAKPTVRRTMRSRRFGRTQLYEKQPGADMLLGRVRHGTYRKYMLRTILAHTDTAAAEAAHRASDEYSSQKLDFKWSADNGFIKFI